MGFEELFWSNVEVGGPNDCWLWRAGKTKRGYGALYVDGKFRYAHRTALELRLGRPLRPGYQACHTRNCTSRACCNPAHLYEGTPRQNTQDAMAMGRLKDLPRHRGEGHWNAAITENTAREVVRLLRDGLAPNEVALRLGVSRNIVYQISEGKSWTHLN